MMIFINQYWWENINKVENMPTSLVPFVPGITQGSLFVVLPDILNSLMDQMGFPGGTNGKEPTHQCRRCKRHGFNTWVGKIQWRRDRLPIPVLLGFPGGSAGKHSACNAGDLSSILGLGRSPGEGKGYPL